MGPDMHFNRLQDSVHPVVAVRNGDGKYQSVAFSRKVLLIIGGVFLATLFFAILITYLATKGSNPPPPPPPTDMPPSQQHKFPITGAPGGPTEGGQVTIAGMTGAPTISGENETEIGNQSMSTEPTAKELRLPSSLTPISYYLKLQVYLPGYEAAIPDGKNLTFDGDLKIKFLCTSETDKIMLNTLKLVLPDKTEAYSIKKSNAVDAKDISVLSTNVSEKLQMVTFMLSETLTAGEEYEFHLTYSGPISTDVLSGLYLSTYVAANGQTRFLAVTQMEPTDARRMVPCFDEPSMKATWAVTVIHPAGSIALSNGIENQEHPAPANGQPDWLETSFKETLKMSSYLLAVVVSDFEQRQGQTKSGTRFRIWARKEAHHQTEYALTSGIKALEYFEQFYGIQFPLEKQDMIAIPDFEAGAMENWGLVTYREKYLLYDPKEYALSEKRRVAVVVAHELAHQWFGNLVTMKWWDDLWLNEGFATFMEYSGTNEISDGKFRMDDYFVIDAFAGAMAKDQRATSHPLFVPIEKSNEINEVFDSISYDKGGTVLRMMDHLIGRESFKRGLNRYLTKFNYSNADHLDLWAALSEEVPDSIRDWNGQRLNLTNFAASWTEQMGYPVVEVTRVDDSKVELKQKRFKLDDKAEEKERFRNPKHGYKWDVPIWHQIDGKDHPIKWLQTDATTIDVKSSELLVINPGAFGFYRVNYDNATWAKIATQLKTDHKLIPLGSRAQLLDDAFTLAEANQLTYQQAMALTGYLDKEDEFLPWANAFSNLAKIKGYFEDEPAYEYVQKYMKRLLEPLYNKLNWNNLPKDYTNDSKTFEDSLQSSILAMYCNLGIFECKTKAAELFRTEFMEACNGSDAIASNCSKVPLSVRKLVYCKGIEHGGEREWNFVFDMYKKERFQLEQSRLMAALTCSSSRWVLMRLLDMTLEGKDIRKQDAASLFTYVGASDAAGPIIWDYLQSNWDKIYSTYKNTKSLLKYVVAACTNFKAEHNVKQFERFIEDNKNVTSQFSIFEIQLEKAHSNLRWMSTHFQPLTEWFKMETLKTA